MNIILYTGAKRVRLFKKFFNVLNYLSYRNAKITGNRSGKNRVSTMNQWEKNVPCFLKSRLTMHSRRINSCVCIQGVSRL